MDEIPPGVDGASAVEAIACEGFECWVSRVDRGEFADRLNQNMENLDWLAAASVHHQRVVAALAANAEILPARFGTIFLSQESLQADVKRRRSSLLESFKRISGSEEWGVKVFSLPTAARPSVVARSGKEYLQRKADALHSQASRALDPEVKTFGEALAKLSRAADFSAKVSSGQRDLEWQASFLVPQKAQGKLQALLKKYALKWKDQRRIECSGPWPPYSFVGRDGE